MSVSNLSFRKRLGLNIYQRFKNSMAVQHPLRYLFWECTLRCNLACRHCGSDCRKNMQHKDMPLSDFLKVVDSIRPYVDPHQTMIVLTGGEPLLRADLEQCGMELYRREFPWGFVTNGLAVTEERIARLMNAGLRAATVSLDGLEDSHNRQRGNPLSFRNACNAIRTFVSLGNEIEFDVVTCVSQSNFHELEAIKELLISMGLKRWRIFTIFPIGRATEHDDLQLPPAQFKQVFDFIKQTRREGRIHVDYGCEGFLGAYEAEVRDNFFFCRAGVTVGSVLVDGSISACPNLRSNFIQGNIYEDNFMDVWNKRYQVFRDRSWTKTGECEQCNHFKFCQGNGMHLRNESGDLLLCHLNKIKEGEKLLNA